MSSSTISALILAFVLVAAIFISILVLELRRLKREREKQEKEAKRKAEVERKVQEAQLANRGTRYSDMNPLAVLGFFTNALHGGGGDVGAIFPRTDAEDMSRGARFIPGEVTMARRAGKEVFFNTDCLFSSCCWYWEMPDGSRIYHYDQSDFENIRDNDGGTCPACGNKNIMGGTFDAPGNKLVQK